MLPAEISKRETITYTDESYFNLTVQMILYRVNNNGEEEQVGLPYLKTQPRNVGSRRILIAKGIASIPVLVAGIIPSVLVDSATEKLGMETKVTDALIDAVDKFTSPHTTVDMDFGFRCILKENNTLQLEADVKSKYFNMQNNKFVMDV